MWLSRDLPPRREWMWQLIIRMFHLCNQWQCIPSSIRICSIREPTILVQGTKQCLKYISSVTSSLKSYPVAVNTPCSCRNDPPSFQLVVGLLLLSTGKVSARKRWLLLPRRFRRRFRSICLPKYLEATPCLTQAYHGPIPAQLICFLNYYQHQRTQTASPAQKVSVKVGLKKTANFAFATCLGSVNRHRHR